MAGSAIAPNLPGRARPPGEVSEHYFACCDEDFSDHGWPHGNLARPGILIMSRLREQDKERDESALGAGYMPLDRISSKIRKPDLR